MATTTNYGWTTPDDTDLVKDGAAAIRTLGSSIDTSFADLLGGTTGQVLAKASGTDLDYLWVDGQIVQIVEGTTTTNVTTATDTFVDTTLTATITPTSASNKIFIIMNQNGLAKSTTDTDVSLRLMRDATVLDLIVGNAGQTGTSATNATGGAGLTRLDDPATTSAITYKTMFMSRGDSATVAVQAAGATSRIQLIEISGV
jgi:hypothetical protein